MNRTRVLIILVIVAIVAGLGYGSVNFYLSRETRAVNITSKKFIDSVLHSKFEDAYKMASKDFQAKQTLDDFTASMDGLDTDKPFYEPPETVVIKQQAHYFQTVRNLPKTTAGRTDGYFSLILVKENGWKVVSIKVR